MRPGGVAPTRARGYDRVTLDATLSLPTAAGCVAGDPETTVLTKK
jgi:hypothetical protein